MTQTPPDPAATTGSVPFSAEDALQFMQRMWNPMGVPMPGFALPGTTPAAPGAGLPPTIGMGFPNPAMMFATLDPAEIERKIGELKVIEGWLQMSLNLMQMSMKTMELQKASLEALRASTVPQASVADDARKQKGRK